MRLANLPILAKFAPLLLCLSTYAAEPALTVKPDHPTGVYTLGEQVTWTIDTPGDRTALTALPYTVKKDAQGEVTKGTLDLSKGPATVTATRQEPGALLLTISNPDPAKAAKPLALGGAVLAPEKIGFSVPEPKDFDAFWQEKLKELKAVPVHPVLEPVENVKYADGLDFQQVTLDNIRGTHVRGQLARPAQGDKFPAMLILQWAGVYGLDKNMVIAPAKMGFLTLNISAHDLPIYEPAAFYKEQNDKALKDYVYQGSEDREKSYFLRMFLGCAQAAEYLASRPDWDGKVMLVTGTSQGGMQSLATAALSPRITALAVMVPAGCDVYGPLASPPRSISWPYWLSNWGPKDRDMKKVQTTAGYFDAAYFASRIHCPSLIALGLIDDTSRPAGVLSAYNSITAPKEVVIMPFANHSANNGSALYNARLNAWEKALLKNAPLPIPER